MLLTDITVSNLKTKFSFQLKKYLLMTSDILLSLFLLYLSVAMFPPEWNQLYLTIGVIGGVMFITIANYQDLYKNIKRQNLYQTAVQLTNNWLIIGLIIIGIVFFIRDTENLARHILLVWILITPVVLISYRLVLKKITPKTSINILVIGEEYKFTKHELQKLKTKNIILVKCKSATIKQIKKLVATNNIHNIVVNITNPKADLIQYITQINLLGTPFYGFEHFIEHYLRKCYIPYTNNNLLHLNNIKPYSKNQLLIKTIIDYLVAIFLAVISLPFALYATYKIKQQSPGEIIYRQPRVGKNNKAFVLNKFRSMYKNQQYNPYTKKNDPRVFPFGQTMRKSRLDELAQIINVLKMDIHIAGPRAEWDILIKEYKKQIPYYNERHLVKPGITGWAQVNYPYGANVEDARQKLMYDLYYIKYWSLALELEIIIKTVKVMLTKQGF